MEDTVVEAIFSGLGNAEELCMCYYWNIGKH